MTIIILQTTPTKLTNFLAATIFILLSIYTTPVNSQQTYTLNFIKYFVQLDAFNANQSGDATNSSNSSYQLCIQTADQTDYVIKNQVTSLLKCVTLCGELQNSLSTCQLISYSPQNKTCVMMNPDAMDPSSLQLFAAGNNNTSPAAASITCLNYQIKLDYEEPIYSDPVLSASSCNDIVPTLTMVYQADCSIPFVLGGHLYYDCPELTLNNATLACGINVCLLDDVTLVACNTTNASVITIEIKNISVESTVVPAPVINSWIIIQQRLDGNLSFNQNWLAYRNGFGDPYGNYWFGLEKLYQLTINKPTFRLEVLTNDGLWRGDNYKDMQIKAEAGFYQIHVGGYFGDSGDVISQTIAGGLATQDQLFSTPDKDNDKLKTGSCATNSGWWFQKCYSINLNGRFGYSDEFRYYVPKTKTYYGILQSRMMIKLP